MSIVDEIKKARRPIAKFEVLHAIAERFSPRVISEEPIPENHIKSILEAARLTPSARYHQPWFFYYVKKGTAPYEKIKHCIPDRNGWALNASLIIIACYIREESPGTINNWAQYDLGAAVISLVLQAQDLGYYSRQIGSFDALETKRQFAIPEIHIPFTLVAMGKMGTEKDYMIAEKIYVEKDLIPPIRKEKISKEIVA